jgi:hypothetical protein
VLELFSHIEQVAGHKMLDVNVFGHHPSNSSGSVLEMAVLSSIAKVAEMR